MQGDKYGSHLLQAQEIFWYNVNWIRIHKRQMNVLANVSGQTTSI